MTATTVYFSYVLQNPLAGQFSPVLSTTVTDSLGNQTTYRFNGSQGVIGVTDPLGQTRTINRDGGNYVVGLTGHGVCVVCGNTSAGNQTFSYRRLYRQTPRADRWVRKYNCVRL